MPASIATVCLAGGPKTIREADIIVSCVDSYSARQDLEVTARRFLIPLVDIGMDVFLVDNNPHIAGQAILSVPDGPCMRCLGFLNDENLRREAEQYGQLEAVLRLFGRMAYSRLSLSGLWRVC